MPATLRELVEQSVPDIPEPKKEPFTTTHLKAILHNSKVQLALYEEGSYSDPESHPSLVDLPTKYPLEFYKKFAGFEEKKMIAEIEAILPVLHKHKMARQEDEIAWLHKESRRGLPGVVMDDFVPMKQKSKDLVGEMYAPNVAAHKQETNNIKKRSRFFGRLGERDAGQLGVLQAPSMKPSPPSTQGAPVTSTLDPGASVFLPTSPSMVPSFPLIDKSPNRPILEPVALPRAPIPPQQKTQAPMRAPDLRRQVSSASGRELADRLLNAAAAKASAPTSVEASKANTARGNADPVLSNTNGNRQAGVVPYRPPRHLQVPGSGECMEDEVVDHDSTPDEPTGDSWFDTPPTQRYGFANSTRRGYQRLGNRAANWRQ